MQVWEQALKALRKEYPNTPFEQRKLKTKADNLKEKYHTHQQCFNASGFGRNPDRYISAAPAQGSQNLEL